MMNKVLIYLILLVSAGSSLPGNAQKKMIDNDTYKNWGVVAECHISNDGKYVSYVYGSQETGNLLGISSVDRKYKKVFSSALDGAFTEDSHLFIFNSAKGLALLKPGADSPIYISNASRYSIPKSGDGRWLAYYSKKNLILRDLSNGKEKVYPDVINWLFNNQGSALLLQTKNELTWVNLPDGSGKTILHGGKPSNFRFDRSGTQLAFVVKQGNSMDIRYFQEKMDSAQIKVTNQSAGIQPGFFIIAETPSFSPDGKNLFFKLDKTDPVIASDNTVITDRLNLWSYQDKIPMSQQLFEMNEFHMPTRFAAMVLSEGNTVIQLENSDIKLTSSLGNQCVLVRTVTNTEESYWQEQQVPDYYLISLKDGSKKRIPEDFKAFYYLSLSPTERFVCWYDTLSHQYKVYEIATGITQNIWSTTLAEDGGIAGWLSNDASLLMYDKFDIWQVDPTGKNKPINLTNGYGRSHNIRLRIAEERDNLNERHAGDSILLAAHNTYTGDNGFCKIKIGVSALPRMGIMQSALLYFPSFLIDNPPAPIKAKKAEVYALLKQTASQAPNVVVTTYFDRFDMLTDVQPQKDYNWLTSEMVHWKMADGSMGNGVLYKPENFDPNKKYPVIFHYYELRTNELHQFRTPSLSEGVINIPWYVSHGYLIFLPDIIHPRGNPGQPALNAVVSAAQYLSTLPYVDAKRMGIEGQSYGGYETNYIITHTNLFAAAQSSAGVSNITSLFGGVGFGDKGLNTLVQEGQFNMGVTPWQNPDLYVKNSPLFSVDKVAAPILLMHGMKDGAVPFAQVVEFFSALRRLKKPVWLLAYDGEGHVLGDPDCALDFNIRQQQFFDHYLKGAQAPKWMKEGISAKEKGLKGGLGFD